MLVTSGMRLFVAGIFLRTGTLEESRSYSSKFGHAKKGAMDEHPSPL